MSNTPFRRLNLRITIAAALVVVPFPFLHGEERLPKVSVWKGSDLEGTGQDPLPFEPVPFHGGIEWSQPLGMVPVPGISGEHYLILERNGLIWHLDGELGERKELIKLGIIDGISYEVKGHRQNLGACFHPDFPNTPEFYLRSGVMTAE